MSKLFTLTILSLCLIASTSEAKEDASICQSYEFHGQLSKQLEEEPILTTTAETGMEIELVVKAKGDLSLDLISLKGRDVVAKGIVIKKLSPRKYLLDLESVVLDKPLGLGAGVGNTRAKKLKTKPKHNCA